MDEIQTELIELNRGGGGEGHTSPTFEGGGWSVQIHRPYFSRK